MSPETLGPEEIAKFEKERTLSDAELLKGGAEYKIDEEGKKRLEVTREHIDEKREEMKKDLEIKETGGKFEVFSNKRQQDKIIKIFESGDEELISEPEVEVTERERGSFLEKLAEREISGGKIKEFLLNIYPPFFDEENKRYPVNLFNEIKSNEQMIEIIQRFVKAQKSELHPGDLGDFLESYPDPYSFDRYINRKYYSAGRKVDESAIEEFSKVVYGKRKEYWDQIKLLKEEAKNIYKGGRLEHEIKDKKGQVIGTRESEFDEEGNLFRKVISYKGKYTDSLEYKYDIRGNVRKIIQLRKMPDGKVYEI